MGETERKIWGVLIVVCLVMMALMVLGSAVKLLSSTCFGAVC